MSKGVRHAASTDKRSKGRNDTKQVAACAAARTGTALTLAECSRAVLSKWYEWCGQCGLWCLSRSTKTPDLCRNAKHTRQPGCFAHAAESTTSSSYEHATPEPGSNGAAEMCLWWL